MVKKPQQYTAKGEAIWLGKGRVICQADTDTAAQLVAAMLNFAVEHGFKWKPAK